MNALSDPHAITTAEELARHYPAPSERVLKKVSDRIEAQTAAFIARAPFCVLATAGARGMHATPRGDEPGFVAVLDEKTLALPDRKGNNRVDALRDVLEDPRVSLLFLIPGIGETLRIAGQARLTADPALKKRFEMQGKEPATVMLITVEEVFTQCARAILRSRIWKGAEKPEGVPTGGDMLSEQSKGVIDGKVYDTEDAARIAANLY
ncbi:pyridoxamine 5'-phosphate oxidase family protein [Acetobacteraceae bacterium H6797]|nr:pyridoxamine 5'-phosphate oxidase family protein [Acetobacteraceae bacterium H6797]